MEVNIAIGKTNYDSFEYIIEKLKNRDRSQQHILITPDRNALNLEERIIDELGEECLTDFSVSTFTRFTNQLILNAKDNYQNKKILSKPACVSIIKNILLSNQNELKFYKNAVRLSGFCSELYETICMFKSCGVLPEKIAETSNEYLNNKLFDIKLVYNKFEEFLQGQYSDSFNKLIYGIRFIDKGLANVNFYFVDFAEFNFQMYQIIEKLMMFSNSVNFALVSNSFDDLKNKHLFVNDIYFNIVDMCKRNGVYCNIIKTNSIGYVKNNILSYTPSVCDNNIDNIVYNVYDFDNVEQEVRCLILKINELFYSKKITSYDQVSVCVSSMETYKAVIDEHFSKSNIPHYIDYSEMLSDHFFYDFIFNYLKISSGNYDVSDVLSFVKSNLFSCGEEVFAYQKFINDYGIKYDALIDQTLISDKIVLDESVKIVYEKLKVFFNKNIAEKSSVNNIVENLISVFADFGIEDKVQFVYDELINKNNIVDARLLKKAYDVFVEILNDVKTIFNSSVVDQYEFYELFKSYVEDISISQPPIEINSIFVGDAVNSYFKKVDYMFILGAVDGEFPKYSQDLGIISDSEINLLSSKYKLSPTISLINKRRKFKAYELMFLSNIETNLFYVSSNSNGEENFPSIFIKSLIDLKVANVYSGKNYFNAMNMITDLKDKKLFLNSDLYIAKDNLIGALKNWDNFYDNQYFRENINYLSELLKEFGAGEIIKNYSYSNDVKKLKNVGAFLKNDNVSISEVETYSKCPYMHYCVYGLKVKDDKKELDNRIYGNIIHEFLKLVVPELVKNLKIDKKNLEKLVKTKFNVAISNKDYIYVLENPHNNFYLESLELECFRVAENILNQFNNSRFLPMDNCYEIPFKNFGAFATFKVGDRVVKLRGVIDRVDVCDNTFRIIDYKTGADNFSDFTELYSGKKIQLIVYLDVFAKSKKSLKPAGAFYMPIKNNFNDETSSAYMLNGILLNSLENFINMDYNLKNESYVSSIVDLKTKKDGEIYSNNTYKNLCLSEEQIEIVRKFAFNLMQNAVEKILDGDIQPYPLKINNHSSCEYCKFHGICGFDTSFNNMYRCVEKVHNVDELKNKLDGEN